MELLYVEEHLSCFNYKKGEASEAILAELGKGEIYLDELPDTQIVFLLEGEVKVSYEQYKDEPVGKNQIMLLPIGTRFRIKSEEDSSFLICKVRSAIQFCEGFALEDLYANNYNLSDNFFVLDFNERVTLFLNSFVPMLTDGVLCCRFQQIKIEEFMLVLRAYYPKLILAQFFRPMLSSKAEFSNFILKNYRRAKSVQELAELANYSQSGFEKHFRKVFGVSASYWLRKKKIANLYHDLVHNDTPIKQLCDDYGFSSHANLCDFCNRYFQMTPTQIRDRLKVKAMA